MSKHLGSFSRERDKDGEKSRDRGSEREADRRDS